MKADTVLEYKRKVEIMGELRSEQWVLGKLGPGQLGPGQLGPG